MPARKASTVSTKRKSPEGRSPAPGSKTKKPRQPSAAATHRFLRGLAAQLASGADETHGVDIDIQGALQAALEALPEGKLKAALLRNQAEAIETLLAEFESVRQQHGEGKREAKNSGGRGRIDAASGGGGDATSAGAGAGAGEVVPCTVQLYRRARAIAEDVGGSTVERKLLKALALSPRAPLELLVDALGATRSGDHGDDPSVPTTLEFAVAGLRSLAKALGADPRAALSGNGLAFFADRAAVLASSAARALRSKCGDGGGDEAAEAAATEGEALGLMLRILQVAGMGLSAPDNAAAAGERRRVDGDDDTHAAVDPSERLLLPCSPETSSPSIQCLGLSFGGVMLTPTISSGPRKSLSLQARSLPSARRSVARLLAHYVVSAAACSIRRQKEAGAAAAVIASARAAAIGRAGTTSPGTGTDGESSDSSSSSSDDEENEEEEDAGDGYKKNDLHAFLSRHLFTLCAANLAGNEPATLEFLRCVGDAFFVAPEAGTAVNSSTSVGGRPSILVCLAPACGRALARLPRPSASPAPTAAQFLRRAYAFRVVDALNQSAASASLSSSSGSAGMGATTTAAVAIVHRSRGVGGFTESSPAYRVVARTPARWDFVGAAGAPPSLLHFLGRPEGPIAVGKGPAGAALKELASRSRSPADVAELLRSSPACAPAALGPLLSAMEGLEGSARNEEDQHGAGHGRREENGDSAATPDVVGGFFVDTGGEGGAGAGTETVLGRLG
ncbi:unnamed protein product, partial [Hapterophycus canaliculatus]